MKQIMIVLSAISTIAFAVPVDEAKMQYGAALGLVAGMIDGIKMSFTLCNERIPEFASVNKKALEEWIHKNSKTIDEVNGHLLKAFAGESSVDKAMKLYDDNNKRLLEKHRKDFSEVAEDRAKEICGTLSKHIPADKNDIESVMKLQLEIIRKQNLKAP